MVVAVVVADACGYRCRRRRPSRVTGQGGRWRWRWRRSHRFGGRLRRKCGGRWIGWVSVATFCRSGRRRITPWAGRLLASGRRRGACVGELNAVGRNARCACRPDRCEHHDGDADRRRYDFRCRASESPSIHRCPSPAHRSGCTVRQVMMPKTLGADHLGLPRIPAWMGRYEKY